MFSFKLPDSFVAQYEGQTPPFGYVDAGGNSLGEITFMRTYSRLKDDGTKETWVEVCRRVVEGMYSIQKDYVKENRLPWNGQQAWHSAKECYDRLFHLKWSPPGRGLWMMGTPFVMENHNSAALQNCAFVSTDGMSPADPSAPFRFLMEASMLGVGVGFDTKGKNRCSLHHPSDDKEILTIEDSREGWVNSVGDLIDSYMKPGQQKTIVFDYSQIRGPGEPIKGFGGVSSGPQPLIDMHRRLTEVFEGNIVRSNRSVGSELITDVANMIGVCVVSGNVRRSAELAMGDADDETFLNLKNYEKFPERNYWSSDPNEDKGWGWMSNNSIDVSVGTDYSPYLENIASNGEPGLIWMDVTRAYGRLIDPPNNKDYRAAGFNPCSEQPLESFEMCTLVETYLNRHESIEDYKRTLKFAYLYAKTVTLLPTHWAQTNAIMQRNRRIGCSPSGMAAFADTKGLPELRSWLETGYDEVQRWDRLYSEWLCVRESIKTTTVKPSGTVSILAGETPGAHWPVGGKCVLRAIRFPIIDPVVDKFREAGYRVELDVKDPTVFVVYFPIRSVAVRSEDEVSIFEKVNLAVLAQRHWSDNGVSVTVSFDQATESKHIGTVLNMYEGQLKAVSFLPKVRDGFVYPQAPYTEISEEEYLEWETIIKPIDFKSLYVTGVEAQGEKFCTTDACEMPKR